MRAAGGPTARAGRFLPAVLSLLLLTACTGGDDPAPEPPTVDDLARAAVARDAVQLLGSAERLAATDAAARPLAVEVVAVHRAHLAALGASIPTSFSTASSTASPSATAAAAVTPAVLRTQEWDAARSALRAADGTTAALSTLLIRIAAARAVDSDLFATEAGAPLVAATLEPAVSASGSTTPAPSGTTTTAAPTSAASPAASRTAGPADTALQDLLAGEHAAVFAYAVVTARAGSRQGLAERSWQDHFAARDELESTLVARGVTPVAASPAYDLGPLPASPAQATALAVRVETGLTRIAAGALTTAGDTRPEVADALVGISRRLARWSPVPVPLPGAAAPAAPTGTSEPSVTSTPLPTVS